MFYYQLLALGAWNWEHLLFKKHGREALPWLLKPTLPVRGPGRDARRQNERGNRGLPVVLLESRSGERGRTAIQLAVAVSLAGIGIGSCVCGELEGANTQLEEKHKKRSTSRSDKQNITWAGQQGACPWGKWGAQRTLDVEECPPGTNEGQVLGGFWVTEHPSLRWSRGLRLKSCEQSEGSGDSWQGQQQGTVGNRGTSPPSLPSPPLPFPFFPVLLSDVILVVISFMLAMGWTKLIKKRTLQASPGSLALPLSRWVSWPRRYLTLRGQGFSLPSV